MDIKDMCKIPNADQNQNFKSTYLADFFMEIKKIYLFEQEIMPSRALFYGIFVFRSDKGRNYGGIIFLTLCVRIIWESSKVLCAPDHMQTVWDLNVNSGPKYYHYCFR